MKILEINGYQYSKECFTDYKFRAKVRITTVDNEHYLDIYTTDPDKDSVCEILLDRKSDAVTSLNISYWCTKEHDDLTSELINESLNEMK